MTLLTLFMEMDFAKIKGNRKKSKTKLSKFCSKNVHFSEICEGNRGTQNGRPRRRHRRRTFLFRPFFFFHHDSLAPLGKIIYFLEFHL